MTTLSKSPQRAFWLWGLLVVLTGAAGVWFLATRHHAADAPAPVPNPIPIPPFTATRFLNVAPDARYIGTAACAECHAENHRSYLLTAHSQAVAEVDPAQEPADASFVHPASGRTYSVYRRDGRLYHREVVKEADGQEIVREERPMRYRIGSGHHARAYAVEVDGFLHESPLNWYTKKNKWDMAPGYDVATPPGFERPINLECMACHAGRAEEIGGAVNRLALSELAIGCESCHGPGSLHRDKWRDKPRGPGGEDLTIVHPGRLSRPLQEAICSSCHLGDPAVVPVRGRQISDFQPGRPLGDFRIHFRFEGSHDPMTLVGHVDQLHLSQCYQKSDMSCLTCHDPHERQKPADSTAFYREKCLSCHQSQGCKLDRATRLGRSPADSCIGCHMPQSPTESPHISFTHHRIGIHPDRTPAGPALTPKLVPTEDPPGLTPLDRERNLGLAYMTVRKKPEYAAYAGEYRNRARKHLETAYAGGLRDPETLLALADLDWRDARPRAREYAQESLRDPTIFPRVKVMALMTVAYSDYQAEDYPAAIAGLEELSRLRRFADDWRLLGLSRLRLDELEKASQALKTAVSIRTFRASSHEALANAYEQLGNTQLAAKERETARQLRALKQD